MNARKSSFEEILQTYGTLVFRTKGRSMLPMLRQNRDLVIIKPPTGRLKRYDVALYRRPGKRYVLHRVMKVRKEEYFIRGDNCSAMERGITDREIIGVLTAFVRDGRTISVTDRRYRCFVRIWSALYPARWLFRTAKRLTRRLKDAL